MENENKTRYVSTNMDFWNAGDESYFSVARNKAKPLPEFTTAIIDNALETGMLRDATENEINEYLEEQEISKLLDERKINQGKSYKETYANYRKYKDNLPKKVEEPKKVEVKQPIKEEPKKEEPKQPINPTQNAINQKPSVSTKSF